MHNLQIQWDEPVFTSQSYPTDHISITNPFAAKEEVIEPWEQTWDAFACSMSAVPVKAAPYTEKAREITLRSRYDQASQLSNEGYLLARKFERFGTLDDLQEAISLTEQSLDITPTNHPDRAGRLNNLGNWLGRRFEWTGAMENLKKAISNSTEAVQSTPHGHPSRAKRLSSLGHWLVRRYERIGNWQDLEQAIALAEEVVRITECHHPDRPAYLAILGNMMALQYQKSHNSMDLELAIFLVRSAITSTPSTSSERGNWLCDLGTILAWKYQRTNSADDLEDAILRTNEALVEMPPDHPNRSSSLNSLGDLLEHKYSRTQSGRGSGYQGENERSSSLSCYVESWNCINAPIFLRIRAAYKAARVLSTLRRWEESSTLLRKAMHLLLTTGLYNLSQRDQQHMLKEFAGLAKLAASIALLGGNGPVQALRFLELGRRVTTRLWFRMESNTVTAKQSILNFEGKMEYCDNHDGLARRSITPSQTMKCRPSIRVLGGKHDFSSGRLESRIDRAHHLSGFEVSPIPALEYQMRAAASEGPVVVINISHVHSAALIVEADAIRWLTLPNISQTDVELKADVLKLIHTSKEIRLREKITMMSQILEWLWDVVASPILKELRFNEPPVGPEWPRMWWIPTGLLSLFPLHAAGYHRRMGSETVIDRVVSSYSTSIHALLQTRRQPIGINPTLEDILLVSMEKTPKCSRLSRAKEEIDVVEQLTQSSALKIKLENPSKEDVVAGLRHCDVFHFAGHSLRDPLDPSMSRLALSDWQENPLTAEDLINMNRHDSHPFLAYLSACSTGAGSAERLHDESLNLMTACQLAGFRHSVGSLWDVYDEYAIDAAREFYSALGQSETIGDKVVALGVHLAARRIRAMSRIGEYSGRGEDNPLAWAAYIQMGP
ncbi:CHAT domain-containing protein [Camillea tinctor]|nr:CHAT domain-containing protein [Camillea tinctor]